MKKNIRDFTLEELRKEMTLLKEPAHRAEQIFLWLYRKNAGSFNEMTVLPKTLIERLSQEFAIFKPACRERLESIDGTEKFLWEMEDGACIESVLIKAKARLTLCVSTQVGCKFRCPFCSSGSDGFTRNLRVSEIVDQVLDVQREAGVRITNIVFMGMGEPLDNYKNLIRAVGIINHSKGIGIGARKITVSTCGVVPGILKLKDSGIQVELSVSLHATDNSLRDELVPVNKKYPLGELISACSVYSKDTGRIITLEYVLIDGRNDSLKDADKLAGIAKRLNAKVNLIACNPGEENMKGTDGKTALVFRDRLKSKGISVTFRSSKGSDILAACGQLAAKKGGRTN